MKKTFRTILAGALALLTVSCYDDSALRGDLEDVKGDLSELQAEFEAFKTKLNGEVSALQTSYNTLNASFTEYKGLNDEQVKTLNTALDALKAQVGVDDNSGIRKSVADVLAALNAYKTEADGKITTAEAALKVLEGVDSSLKTQLENLSAQLGTKADAQTLAALVETVESITVRSIAEDDKGNIVITLANNQTLTVAKDGNGVVKVVDGEWVVSGPEGDVALGLPITQENLVFNIDWRTGELCYAVVENPTEDDWVSTGVNVGGNNVGSAYGVITDVDVWGSSKEYVSVRVDGEWYKLMLMADADSSSAAVLEILAGKTIVPMGGSKVVDLNAVGITDIYVMSKPDGWKAIINGNKLTVTGPVEGNPYAEHEGLVLLHGTTETGQCIVAKLAVTTSTAGLEIIVDDAAATVTIKNGLVVDSSQMSGGIMPFNLEGDADNTEVNDLVFDSFMFGWMLPEDLARAGSLENYIMQNNIFPIDQIVGMLQVERGVYSADNPIETLTFKIADLWALLGMEWQEGTYTICYATPQDGPLPDFSGLVYDYYNPVVISFTEIEATHSDISLSVTRNGASSYIIGMGTTEEFSGRTYMEQLELRFESWVYAKGMSPFGAEVGNVQNEEVKLSKYDPDGEVSLLRPSTEYYVYAFPVIEGKPYDEYVFATDFLPYVKTFKTADLVEGASVNVTIAKDEDATTYTSIVATLSAVGAETVFYKWYDSESSVDEFETNAELVKDVSSTGYMALANMDVVVRSQKSLKAGESQYLVAVGADKDGKYGVVSEMSLSTKAYPYDDENITVAVKDVTFNSETGKPTVTYTVTGATHLAVYSTSSYNGKAGLSYSGTNSSFVGNVLGTSKNYYNTILEVVDGEVAVEYANYSTSNKYSFASGVNLMNNKVTALSTPLVTDIATYESNK